MKKNTFTLNGDAYYERRTAPVKEYTYGFYPYN